MEPLYAAQSLSQQSKDEGQIKGNKDGNGFEEEKKDQNTFNSNLDVQENDYTYDVSRNNMIQKTDDSQDVNLVPPIF